MGFPAKSALQNSNFLTFEAKVNKKKIKFEKIWGYQNEGPPETRQTKLKLFNH